MMLSDARCEGKQYFNGAQLWHGNSQYCIRKSEKLRRLNSWRVGVAFTVSYTVFQFPDNNCAGPVLIFALQHQQSILGFVELAAHAL